MARQTMTLPVEHERGDLPSDHIPFGVNLPTDQRVVSEKTLFGEIITAQKCPVQRDDAKVLRKCEAAADAAGAEFFYRYPVKNRKTGGTDYIEGPSIECAMTLAKHYGNNRVESAVVDVGAGWLIYSRFVDLETGFSLMRPFLQSKTGSRLGGDDDERRLQIAMSIGVSKSQRNVVNKANADLADRMFKRAKQGLVTRIGARLPEYRQRMIESIKTLGDDVLARVERAYNRKASEWLAPDIAAIITQAKAINDGMATIDETWPKEPPAEPSRTTDVTDQPSSSGAPQAAADSSAPRDESGPAGAASPQDAQRQGVPPADEPLHPHAHDDEPTRTDIANAHATKAADWTIAGDVVGQDEIIKRLTMMLGLAASVADVEEIEKANAERIAKITGTKKAALNKAIADRKLQFRPGSGG
jgi:hypothetical protein